MKITNDFEIKSKLMDSYVCLEAGWTDLLSNERSLGNSIASINEVKFGRVKGRFVY